MRVAPLLLTMAVSGSLALTASAPVPPPHAAVPTTPASVSTTAAVPPAPVSTSPVLARPDGGPPRPHRAPPAPPSPPARDIVAVTTGPGPRGRETPANETSGRWLPPVDPLRVERGFQAPAQNWLPGHRGVDLAAPDGAPVRAPADGRVAFVGMVAGKPVLSLDHRDPDGDGLLRTTYEPVLASVDRGATVRRGEVVGTVVVTGISHCAQGCLHWGARRDGNYLDPLGLLGGRVRLLTPWSRP